MNEKNKPQLIERFADNGEHSHYELIDHEGNILWTEDNEPRQMLTNAVIEENLKGLWEIFKDAYVDSTTGSIKDAKKQAEDLICHYKGVIEQMLLSTPTSPTLTDEMIKTAGQSEFPAYSDADNYAQQDEFTGNEIVTLKRIGFRLGAEFAREQLQPTLDRLRSEREKDAIAFAEWILKDSFYLMDFGLWHNPKDRTSIETSDLHTIYVHEKNGEK